MRPEAPVPHLHPSRLSDDPAKFPCHKAFCTSWEYETRQTPTFRLADALDNFVVQLLADTDREVLSSYEKRYSLCEKLADSIIEIVMD